MSEPMEPSQLLELLYKDLEPWVKARRGYLTLAGDPGEVLEALVDGPNTFRVVLHWVGDEDNTEQALGGIVDNTFEVWLLKNKGMRIKPGEFLIKGNPPFLSLLSDLRAEIRSLEFPEDVTNRYFLYRGAKQMEPELSLQVPTTGYRMTFEITTALPGIQHQVLL
jgi:hypothetical protein